MPNQGVPVIFKNKIAYGYAEKSVQAYDVSVSDYNALTEQQQLDGSIRFIQGVDAIPNGSNVWAKLGTTPLAEGLPRDCSQAVNELKSNLAVCSQAINEIKSNLINLKGYVDITTQLDTDKEYIATENCILFVTASVTGNVARGYINAYVNDTNNSVSMTGAEGGSAICFAFLRAGDRFFFSPTYPYGTILKAFIV